jgi:hypothetical protein
MYGDIQIREIIADLKRRRSSIDFIEASHMCFAGARCLVVSAGPSAIYWENIYKSMDKPVVVVCVKQAIELSSIDKLCHVHFCNPWNLKKYQYDDQSILRVFTSSNRAPRSFQDWDVTFNVARAKGGLETSLLSKQCFSNYTISNSKYSRPWGPGIMIETVLYALMHMGCADITTIGWDCLDGCLQNNHFYDQDKSTDPNACEGALTSISVKTKLRSTFSRIPGLIIAKSYLDFLNGRKYNSAFMLPGEAKLLKDSVPSFLLWMKQNGINMKVLSRKSLYASSPCHSKE